VDELDAFPHCVVNVCVEVKSSVDYYAQVFYCILLVQLFVVKVHFVVPLDLRYPLSYHHDFRSLEMLRYIL